MIREPNPISHALTIAHRTFIKPLEFVEFWCLQMITWLVDLTILKNISSSMGRMTSHILWKIKIMFETTNQSLFVEPPMHSRPVLDPGTAGRGLRPRFASPESQCITKRQCQYHANTSPPGPKKCWKLQDISSRNGSWIDGWTDG